METNFVLHAYVSVVFVKELVKCEIVDLLHKICRLSLHSGSLPEDWKMANVIQTFFFKKKKDQGGPGKLQTEIYPG